MSRGQLQRERRWARQLHRFGERVDRSAGPYACWPWTGARNRDGYGRLWFKDGDEQAHRAAYIVAHGYIPVRMCVMHSCDNPPCCNPAHLSIGTKYDNAQDMVQKGRHSHGERNWSARLTKDQVFAIRVLFAAGEATRYELARRFQVSHRQICYIIKGRSWKSAA